MTQMKTSSTLLIAAAMLAASMAEAATFSLIPSQTSVAPGAAFSLELQISGLGDHAAPFLGGFDVDVSYDSALFSLTGVQFGAALGDIDAGEATADDDTAVPGSANVFELSILEPSPDGCVFCISPYLQDLQGSAFGLATLSFQALQPGTGSFGLTIQSATDGNGDNLPATFADPAHVTAVPLPATLWLFASAALALGGFRRRPHTL